MVMQYKDPPHSACLDILHCDASNIRADGTHDPRWNTNGLRTPEPGVLLEAQLLDWRATAGSPTWRWVVTRSRAESISFAQWLVKYLVSVKWNICSDGQKKSIFILFTHLVCVLHVFFLFLIQLLTYIFNGITILNYTYYLILYVLFLF